jgi:hypothetical protein
MIENFTTLPRPAFFSGRGTRCANLLPGKHDNETETNGRRDPQIEMIFADLSRLRRRQPQEKRNIATDERQMEPNAACGRNQKINRTADYADTRGWAIHLVRNYPRVSA